MIYNLRLSEEPLVPPSDAEFSFVIDFAKSSGNPRRVFDAASHLIEGFEIFDQALALSFDKNLEPIMVLEDIEEGSLKVWLKNVLKRIDDEALRTVDWKKIIGDYLVRAKYILLEFCDSDEIKDLSKIQQLKLALKKLAEETDVRQLPDYPEIHEAKLVSAIIKVQKAKSELEHNDTLRIEAGDNIYEVDISKTDLPPKIEASAEQRISSPGEMILTVRKPDLLKNSMWQFMHGPNLISTAILDQSWLDDFHNRLIAIYPGDALRCKVMHEYTYDKHGNLESDKIQIVEILEVIRGPAPQEQMI